MEFITVRTFQNYFEAHLLLTKLQSGGVECYLKDESIVTVGPFLSHAVGGIKLIVRKENEKEVLAILEEMDEAYRKTAVCPKCGNHTIERVPGKSSSNRITAILTFLFGDLALSAKNVYQCSSCKYECDTLSEPYYELPVYGEEKLN